jgi:hypothetical protein
MLIKTIGKPAHVSINVVKKAANFYGKYLLNNTKLFNNIELTMIFEKFPEGDNDYAYCDWVDDNHCSREFHITVDKTLTKKETLLALAHEMVHLKQYAKGELKDIFRPAKMIKWHGDRYMTDGVDYWEQPWEIEAYGREKGLYFKFLYHMKNGEKDIPCQLLKPIKNT